MITKSQLQKAKGWLYSYISDKEVMIMSGWKFYIFGQTIEDSEQICSLITPIAKKYNLTMKVASQNIINRNTNKKGIAWSVGIIYLNSELFEDKRVPNLISDIDNALKDYQKTGVIVGAKSINGKLHYRYDLSFPIDPAKGVDYHEYLNGYRGESGDYNIPGNEDITSSLSI